MKNIFFTGGLMANIFEIPADVIRMLLLDYLSITSAVALMSTCKSLRNFFVDVDTFWKRRFERDMQHLTHFRQTNDTWKTLYLERFILPKPLRPYANGESEACLVISNGDFPDILCEISASPPCFGEPLPSTDSNAVEWFLRVPGDDTNFPLLGVTTIQKIVFLSSTNTPLIAHFIDSHQDLIDLTTETGVDMTLIDGFILLFGRSDATYRGPLVPYTRSHGTGFTYMDWSDIGLPGFDHYEPDTDQWELHRYTAFFQTVGIRPFTDLSHLEE